MARKNCLLIIFILNFHKSFGSTDNEIAGNLEASKQPCDCIALQQCSIIHDMFHRWDNLPEEDRQFVKNSQCGYNNDAPEMGSKVLVCCPTQIEKRFSTEDQIIYENVEIDNSYCGIIKKPDGQKISSGSQIDFPWMALIEYVDIRDETRRGFNCSGTLINNRYILTAAHCMHDKYWKPHRIRLGQAVSNADVDCENNIDCSLSNEQRLSVEIDEIIVHPNYPVDLYHDIALIRMKEHIEYTDYIRPICLPFSNVLNKLNLINAPAEFGSWGQVKNTGVMGGHGKFKLSLRIWDTQKCHNRYRILQRNINLKYEICAGGKQNEDTCQGDSGGALMYSVDQGNMKVYYAVGVMAAGTYPCGLQGWPSISIDVQSHLQWILYQLTV